MTKIDYDITIVGSSFIGLSAAIILAKQGLKIAIVTTENISQNISRRTTANINQKLTPQDQAKPNQQNSRLFALSHRSSDILAKYQILIQEEFIKIAQPILHIRAVDQESTAKVDFLPADIGLQEFGYMIDEGLLKNQLLQKTIATKNIAIIDCANISDICETGTTINLTYQHQDSEADPVLRDQVKVLKSRLLLGCDGKNSVVRSLVRIKTKTHEFNQSALAFDISHPSWNHDGVAIEKFYAGGPFAILPKAGGYQSAIIWTEKKEAANFLENCSAQDLEFLAKKRLDGYLGDEVRIITEPKFHELKCVTAAKLEHGRVLLLGDSAHSIHPIAGQGLNLGMRDVETLAELVMEYHELGLDIGSWVLTSNYAKKRKYDIKLMTFSTSLINNLFSNQNIGLKISRRIGLKVFDRCSIIKNLAMMYAAT